MSKTPSSSGHVHGYTKDKDALIKRLHRIEGQVRGIERMVDDDRYCIDILTQIAAVNTALESLAFQLLDQHVKHCVAGAIESGDKKETAQKTTELLEAVHRFSRTK
jgi:CsoR family transcriptional regulator, copper-sensing transcriptional repressor